jgi:transposase
VRGRPLPASSGKTRRHRLHRGGDRDANKALHLAVVVRMRFCPRTRAYVERRTKQGLSKPEIMRCVKRYLAREVYHALVADFEALHAT